MTSGSDELQRNKALAQAAIGIWSTGDTAKADAIFAPGYVMRQRHDADSASDLGLAALFAFVQEFRSAFPDLVDTIDLQVAEGDLVATRFTSTGTYRGVYRGLAPTGRRLSWSGIIIDRVRDGRLVESWGSWDLLGMLQQMGAVTPKG